MVNTTITAPGALVALALMYLKSHNRQVVEKIKVPETFEALDCVTPTVLTLKVLAKNLILWDHIDCTQAWVQN
jgi:anaphase-promoting complex subunit 1